MPYYVISARAVKKDQFLAEPGPVLYLEVPDGHLPSPAHKIKPGDWAKTVQHLAASIGTSPTSPPSAPITDTTGDVLIFVHGYNNDLQAVASRQKMLQDTLIAERWRGLVISFDWPSNNSTLNYLEDRWDAAEVAIELVRRGITLLARGQESGCSTNVHLLGHSTGAFVIMEAFIAAEKKRELFTSDWKVSQVAFIGGDVSSESLSEQQEWSRPLYHRLMRLTNYSNPFDSVLGVSNAKRLGASPRVGRVGLPITAPRKAVNVNCAKYFQSLNPTNGGFIGTFAHSWHIGDRVFARDLAMTLEGRIDREYIPTRECVAGELSLRNAQRPEHEELWTRQ